MDCKDKNHHLSAEEIAMKRRWDITLLTVGLVFAVSACGGDEENSSAAPSTGADADTEGSPLELVVGMPTTAADSLNYVAAQAGFFEDNNVNVEIQDNLGANTASLLASGQVDVIAHAAGVPIAVAVQGRQTSIIYSLTGGGQGGSVVGNPDVASLEDLRDRSDCRIGSFAAGSSAFGFAQLYAENLGLDCDFVPFQDAASQVGALAAKRVDAVVGAYPNFSQAVDQGQATVLVDTRDEKQAEKYVGEPYSEVVISGLTDNLKEKSDAVVRYLRGLAAAAEYIADTDPAEVAAVMKKQASLAERTVEQVESDVTTLEAYRFKGTDEGHISEKQWDLARERIADWGIQGYSPDDEKFAYDAQVDMSYYDEAFN
jgi:ABC-type nitrate/sulfonate/bicarbonate transport system substrate-binding protein